MDSNNLLDSLLDSQVGVIVLLVGVFMLLAFAKKLIKLAIFAGIAFAGYYMFMQ